MNKLVFFFRFFYKLCYTKIKHTTNRFIFSYLVGSSPQSGLLFYFFYTLVGIDEFYYESYNFC